MNLHHFPETGPIYGCGLTDWESRTQINDQPKVTVGDCQSWGELSEFLALGPMTSLLDSTI